MATITSDSFDAANAGFNALSSDTTRIYYDASLTINAEGEPSVSTERTDFQGAFTDTLPFTLVTSAVSVGTTELNTMRNGTIISTNGAAGFGNSADYTFRAACNIDWDNMNFMCSNGLVNGFGVAGSGSTVRPLGRVVNSTFGTTMVTDGSAGGDVFTDSTRDIALGSGSNFWIAATEITFAELQAEFPIGTVIVQAANAASAAAGTQYTVSGYTDSSSFEGIQVTPAISPNTITGNNIYIVTQGPAVEPTPVGNWFVNLANVDASFVFANNALDAAVLNTAAAGNYVVGLAFAGTVRQQSNNNNSYTIRINNFNRAYEGSTNASPWTIMMNNSFANNATTPYAAGVGNDAIAHYETNSISPGTSVLMINEQFEGDAFFAAKRGGESATFVSTYSWNPTFITPASATIADVKLVGVGSDVIYQVPTGTTNRVSTFATQFPVISDGTIVNSSNGYLVQAGTLAISPNNATSLQGVAARSFADGSLLVTPVTKRAKSYTHLVDTVVTSEIDAIDNSGGNNGSFTFTESSATTADVDTSLIAGTFADTRALNGSAVAHNEGAALYSRLKADWYGEDGLNEPLTSFANTATAQTISSIHNINLSNTTASASVDATGGIVLPATAGITGDATFNHLSTTGNISVGVSCTNMSLTGAAVTITAVSISGGTLSGSLSIVDGATFNTVEFDGTINAYTGTQLDLSTCTFGSSLAATAGSGSGKTVTLPTGTSAGIQSIFTTAGWTVAFPAIEYTIALPGVVGNYIIRNNGATFASGATTADGPLNVTITNQQYTDPQDVIIYWTAEGYFDIVQRFGGMDTTISETADPNISSVDFAGEIESVTHSNGITTYTGTTTDTFTSGQTNRWWNRAKANANYTLSTVAYREEAGSNLDSLIELSSKTEVRVNGDFIKFATGSGAQVIFNNLVNTGTDTITSSIPLTASQIQFATSESFTTDQWLSAANAYGVPTADDIPTTTEIGTEMDTQLRAGKLTRVGRTT